MTWLERISIKNNSESFAIELNSNLYEYPGYITKELIFGRKCFEIKWLDGDCAISFGFTRDNDAVFFFGNYGNSVVIIRKNGNLILKKVFHKLLRIFHI